MPQQAASTRCLPAIAFWALSRDSTVFELVPGLIRRVTELVKMPKDLLEYVIVHEMAHLLEPTHNERFVTILDKHYPT